MSAEWVEKCLGDILLLQRGHDLPSQSRVEGSVPIMGSAGLTGYHNYSKAKGPGVVIGRSGNSMGEVHFAAEDYWPLNTALYVKDFKGNDERFIYYLLKTTNFDQFNSGSAQKSLNRNAVHPLKVMIPESLDEQKRIAKVLADLEGKIELNRQINQTLEQIAQTIFKSWFVDFEPVKAKIEAKTAGRDPERAAMEAIAGRGGFQTRPNLTGRTGLEPAPTDQLSPEQYQQLAATSALFPDELVESELGLIPAGWKVVSLDSLSTKISKGTTPTKQDIASAADDPLIPFIKVKDIGDDGELNRDGIDKIPDSVHRGALKRSILNTSDILFSIAGTIGRIAVVEKDLQNSNANQAVAFVRLKNSDAHLGLCLQFLKSQRLQDTANAAIVQGVQANLSLGSLGGFKILLPSKDLLAEWNNKYRSLFDETRCLAGETRTLATLRDTLLPKLLSGEISLAESSLGVEGAINA